MSDRPLFEIGPGSLRWDGNLLRRGDPVPDVLLLTLTQDDEDSPWYIPGYPNCTRAVRKSGHVVEGEDAALVVDLTRQIRDASTFIEGLEERLREERKAHGQTKAGRTRAESKVIRLEDELDALKSPPIETSDE